MLADSLGCHDELMFFLLAELTFWFLVGGSGFLCQLWHDLLEVAQLDLDYGLLPCLRVKWKGAAPQVETDLLLF